jgi:hypothetical protein
MGVSELIRMLEAIRSSHGEIPIRCGQYRIGGIALYHGPLGEVAAFVPRRPGGAAVAYLGPERRTKAKRRWDD